MAVAKKVFTGRVFGDCGEMVKGELEVMSRVRNLIGPLNDNYCDSQMLSLTRKGYRPGDSAARCSPRGWCERHFRQ